MHHATEVACHRGEVGLRAGGMFKRDRAQGFQGVLVLAHAWNLAG
jgi:hypothetical protein